MFTIHGAGAPAVDRVGTVELGRAIITKSALVSTDCAGGVTLAMLAVKVRYALIYCRAILYHLIRFCNNYA